MSKSKEWNELIKSRNLTDADAEKLLADETKQIAESLKVLPREVFEAQLAAAKAEEARRAEQTNAEFHKQATYNSAETAAKIRQQFGFDPGWR